MSRQATARTRRRRDRAVEPAAGPDVKGLKGGRLRPLSDADVSRIDAAARDILERTGMSDAPDNLAAAACGRGAVLADDGRLRLPSAVIDTALADLRSDVVLHGRDGRHDLHVSGGRVHVGSGGAAPMVVDLETGRYRESTLADLYDAARLCDALGNIHFFSRSVVARDMPDVRQLDVNTAYASLAGTTKHVMTSISEPGYVDDIATLCFEIAGGADAFRERPFLSLNVNHVAPPLRFAPEACAVLARAVRLGIPVHCNTFGQVGASSPVTPAGALAQAMAETLVGAVLAWAVDPDATVVFGARPMVTDLRTGAMSGGGGEQAHVMAATAQMADHYGLAHSTIAGATDAKTPDAQSGYEKALGVALAAQAGSTLITQACGMQANLMAVAFEGYVIDNDMLGAVLRTLAPFDVNDETLMIAAIDAVARGEGHFLGRAETYERMRSDFLYPDIADRRSPEDWEAAGAPDIRTRARDAARDILASHCPDLWSDKTDVAIRDALPIALARTRMKTR